MALNIDAAPDLETDHKNAATVMKKEKSFVAGTTAAEVSPACADKVLDEVASNPTLVGTTPCKISPDNTAMRGRVTAGSREAAERTSL